MHTFEMLQCYRIEDYIAMLLRTSIPECEYSAQYISASAQLLLELIQQVMEVPAYVISEATKQPSFHELVYILKNGARLSLPYSAIAEKLTTLPAGSSGDFTWTITSTSLLSRNIKKRKVSEE